MSTYIQWDKKGFSRQALKLSLLKKQASAQTLREEAKLFVRDCAAMTPPIGPHPIQESPKAQLARGEKAVSTDINKLFVSARGLKVMKALQGLPPQLVRDDYGTYSYREAKLQHDLEKAIKYGRVDDVAAILKAIGIDYWSVALEATEQYHQGHLSKKGRVMKGFRQFILRSQTIERIRKLKLSHVGRAKAGWLLPAKKLGVKLPAWVTRHSGQPGEFKDESEHPLKPTMTIGNLVGWAQQFEGRIGIVKSALALRVASMKKRVEILIKKGY